MERAQSMGAVCVGVNGALGGEQCWVEALRRAAPRPHAGDARRLQVSARGLSSARGQARRRSLVRWAGSWIARSFLSMEGCEQAMVKLAKKCPRLLPKLRQYGMSSRPLAGAARHGMGSRSGMEPQSARHGHRRLGRSLSFRTLAFYQPDSFGPIDGASRYLAPVLVTERGPARSPAGRADTFVAGSCITYFASAP